MTLDSILLGWNTMVHRVDNRYSQKFFEVLLKIPLTKPLKPECFLVTVPITEESVLTRGGFDAYERMVSDHPCTSDGRTELGSAKG